MTQLLTIIHNRRHLLKHRREALSGLTMMSDSTPLKGERDGDFQSPTVESTDENQPKDSTADSDKDVLGGDFDDDIDGPTSSVNNIIPMDKLKNGWFVLSSYMQVSSGRYLCNIKLLSSRMFPQNRFHSCHLSNRHQQLQRVKRLLN